MLYSTHAMLATLTAVPELVISEDESKTLATAVGNVMRHYDVPLMSQKTLDHIALVQCVATIYGTRIFAANMRRAANRAKTVRVKPEGGVPDTTPTNPGGHADIPGIGPVAVQPLN